MDVYPQYQGQCWPLCSMGCLCDLLHAFSNQCPVGLEKRQGHKRTYNGFQGHGQAIRGAFFYFKGRLGTLLVPHRSNLDLHPFALVIRWPSSGSRSVLCWETSPMAPNVINGTMSLLRHALCRQVLSLRTLLIIFLQRRRRRQRVKNLVLQLVLLWSPTIPYQ